MKYINKLLIITCLVGFFTACDTTDIDLLDNPNAVTPDNVSLDALYNNIQITYGDIYGNANYGSGALARMYHAGSFTYQAQVTPGALNAMWNNAYAGLFEDADIYIPAAEEIGLQIHAATVKIMKAHILMVLVDLLGNVPFSEANQGVSFISPKSDSGESVYNAAIALLDEAIAQINGAGNATPLGGSDYLNGGSATGWVKFANTLKLRAALNTRLVDPSGSASTINDLVKDPSSIISSSGDDFQIEFSTNRNNPNSRHPFYNNHYEVNDGNYLSNYYMWMFKGDKEDENGNTLTDPRIRYYFYRKVDDSVGQDATTYSCHFSTLPDQSAQPDHWEQIDPRLPYCVATEDGYSGRDHLNGSGIPPDGPIRTSYGLYPAGGQFDDNTVEDTRMNGTTGGQGEGIHPVMLSSFVDFMRAEAALTLGTGEDARALLESGIRASMAKVRSFESLVSGTFASQQTDRQGNVATVRELYAMTDEDVDNYVAFVLGEYDAASDSEKLDVVITEYYLAAWGNGYEAYNMWRRTGFPGNMQPGLEVEAGPFARSFLYPDQHVERNANVEQKAITDRVFWDDGSVDLY